MSASSSVEGGYDLIFLAHELLLGVGTPAREGSEVIKHVSTDYP